MEKIRSNEDLNRDLNILKSFPTRSELEPLRPWYNLNFTNCLKSKTSIKTVGIRFFTIFFTRFFKMLFLSWSKKSRSKLYSGSEIFQFLVLTLEACISKIMNFFWSVAYCLHVRKRNILFFYVGLIILNLKFILK